MNNRLFAALLVLGAFTVAGVPAAHAQETVRASVPFPFVVGNELLPAGDYSVTPTPDNNGVLTIARANATGTTSFVFVQPDAKLATDAFLAFRKVGDRYFLSQVAAPGNDVSEIVLPRYVVVNGEVVKLAAYMSKPVHKS